MDALNELLDLKDSTARELRKCQELLANYTSIKSKATHDDKNKLIGQLFDGLMVAMDNNAKLAVL